MDDQPDHVSADGDAPANDVIAATEAAAGTAPVSFSHDPLLLPALFPTKTVSFNLGLHCDKRDGPQAQSMNLKYYFCGIKRD